MLNIKWATTVCSSRQSALSSILLFPNPPAWFRFSVPPMQLPSAWRPQGWQDTDFFCRHRVQLEALQYLLSGTIRDRTKTPSRDRESSSHGLKEPCVERQAVISPLSFLFCQHNRTWRDFTSFSSWVLILNQGDTLPEAKPCHVLPLLVRDAIQKKWMFLT